MGTTYYQNAKTLPEYYDALQQKRLPVVRGYALTTDDVIRRDVIMAIMCQGHLDFTTIEDAHSIRMADYFANELGALDGLAKSGLVTISERSVEVTMAGWFLVRAIAMVFDRHLQTAKERHRFSKVV